MSESTREGFMEDIGKAYVQLIAIERRSDQENWWDYTFSGCTGGTNTTISYQELLAGTDTLLDGHVPFNGDPDEYDKKVADCAEATNMLFPNFFNKKYTSVPVLASVVLGPFGQAMINDNGEYLRCTYSDLTPERKAIYDSVKALYGDKADLHLITWID